MKKYIVYVHIAPNGKKYVGITSQAIQKRWRNGKGYLEYSKEKRQFNQHFVNAIKKYGWNNFEHIILEDNLDELEAREKEKQYIKLYDSFKNGYNATTGGEGCWNHKVSEEAKEKISKANKGNIPWNKGISLSEEAKKHLSEMNKGKPSYVRTPEHKLKMSKIQKGKHNISEETRKRLSESHKGQPGYWTGKHRSPETIEKLRIATLKNPNHYWLGKKRSPETIEKMKASLAITLKKKKETQNGK